MNTQRKSFSGSRSSKCKGPEARTCLVYVQNSEENRVSKMASGSCSRNEIRDLPQSQII